jgi:hypothetical protein
MKSLNPWPHERIRAAAGARIIFHSSAIAKLKSRRDEIFIEKITPDRVWNPVRVKYFKSIIR